MSPVDVYRKLRARAHRVQRVVHSFETARCHASLDSVPYSVAELAAEGSAIPSQSNTGYCDDRRLYEKGGCST